MLETAARIFVGLAGAFMLGCLLALPIGRYPKHRELRHAVPGVSAGHSGAVLGDHRHHLVPRHRIPHPLHHGDHDAAGVHLPGARLLPLDVEGPVRDDHVVPAERLDAVPRADRADHRAGHPHRLEDQPRQRRARRGGGRAGRRDRRRRLRAAAPAAVVRHGGRARLDHAARAVRAGGAADHRLRSRTGCCATGRSPSGRRDPDAPTRSSASPTSPRSSPARRQRDVHSPSTGCRSRSRRARSSPCSARPAAASRPCSTCWPG